MSTDRLLQTFTAEGFMARMYERPDGSCFIDRADGDIDADGSPRAYGPGRTGTDDIRNALDGEGNFVGILTGAHGRPLLQGRDDPAPGFYISTTSYEFAGEPIGTQRRYLNGEKVPFIVLPPIAVKAVHGVVLGCRARVSHLKSNAVAEGIVGDIGPRSKVGELSPAMARALGINPDPRRGGEDAPVLRYEWWPGQMWRPEFPLMAWR